MNCSFDLEFSVTYYDIIFILHHLSEWQVYTR